MSEHRDDAVSSGLYEGDVDADPIRQFDRWFQDALAVRPTDANAMTLATATRDGGPSARMVLLKGYDQRGFVFFTNYESRKGRELAANPSAALVFYWPELHRQVRVTGDISRVTPAESDAYFNSRPLGSRVSALASRQSAVLGGRDELERAFAQVMEQYGDGEPPRPPYWGGFRVAPKTIEFWQGRPDRLHDRLCYTRQPEGFWRIERLSP